MKTMAEHIDEALAFELLQQEVPSAALWFEVNRREFLKLFGGGLVVCLCARRASAQESGRGNFGGHELPKEIAAWLHINEDGHVTGYTGKVEMGQNIRTSLAQQVAEELRVPVNTIAMVMGDTDLTPWDAGTFGSRTTPTMGPQLKTMAVAAREQLVNMAAQLWKTQPSALVAADGKVTNPQTHQSLTYGEITHGQKLVQLVEDPPFTPASQWKVAGTPVPKVEGRDFVTGKHRYTSDLTRSGMMYGKVVRPAGFKATLVSVNDEAAKKMPGITVVHDGDFIGVAAPDSWSAERAVEAIKAEWKVPPQPSNQQLVDYLKKNVNDGERGSRHATGSVEEALASADAKLSATYTVQYIAHTPLEPRAAVAEWSGDKLTVWTGTQRPFAVRDELAAAFHIPPEKVRVMVPDTGSAYGGKHTGECAIEAARLAKAAGRPVKLGWTREEEFTWAYFRPGGVIETRSGAKHDGTVVAWEFHNYNSGPSGIGTPYNIPNQLIQFHPVDSPLRQGSYRGLAATANHFARESHMDELAHAIKMDPLEFRLKNLTDPRVRAVLQAAAEKIGWGKMTPTAGRGFGLACGFEKGSYFGTCAEVDVDRASRNVQIRRVVEAFECGAVVNPNGLRNQVEGAIVQAIGGALFEAVRFDNGRILNPHFAQYRVPRFRDTPQIDVVLVDRKDLLSAGAGETPIMGLAPAVGNAIFAAAGVRLRSLPMAPDGVRTPAKD
jgi:CO/xanthine dehydrogenase Mo-binding subunit